LRTRAIPERFCGDDSLYKEALYQIYAPLPLAAAAAAYHCSKAWILWRLTEQAADSVNSQIPHNVTL